MAVRPSDLARSPEARPFAEVRRGLVDELRNTLAPLAKTTTLALAYVTQGDIEWIVANGTCPCSCNPAGPIACLQGSKAAGRYQRLIEVTWEGRLEGSVYLCCDLAARPLEATVQRVIQSTLRTHELTRQKSFLQAELSASRESLEAVYEISSNLRSLQNTEELLHRILNRAAALQDGLQVILWLLNDKRLEPAASKNVSHVAARSLVGGLVGKTLTNRTSIVLNGRARLATLPDLEPELRAAVSVALVPIATRQGLLGVLETWQEHEAFTFDARMLYLLETLALLAAMVVENDRLHRASLERERLHSEFEIGSRIQQVLLLGRTPLDLELIRAAAITLPSAQIDGDFYDFVEHEQTLDVIIGDVMGKGVPAALVGAATKNHFLRAMNYLLASHGGILPEPKEILSIVNAELAKQLIGLERFVTLCYARFDLKRKTAELIDCGHTRTIHYSTESGQYALLQGQNMPLGFTQGEVYVPIVTPFAAGDVFLFYSDGVTETTDSAGEFYGEVRLAELVRGNHFLDPNDIVEIIRQDVLSFSRTESFQDDLTCVAVKIQDMEATIPSKRGRLDLVSDLAELPRVRKFVRTFCEKNIALGCRAEDLDQLELAVVEATTNIIKHGYQGQKDRPIRLQADLFLNRISVRLYHRGQAFDPGPAEIEPIQEPRENHMGLYIIQQSVDKVRYYRSKHGENCIHLVKQLKQAFSGGNQSGDPE